MRAPLDAVLEHSFARQTLPRLALYSYLRLFREWVGNDTGCYSPSYWHHSVEYGCVRERISSKIFWHLVTVDNRDLKKTSRDKQCERWAFQTAFTPMHQVQVFEQHVSRIVLAKQTSLQSSIVGCHSHHHHHYRCCYALFSIGCHAHQCRLL